MEQSSLLLDTNGTARRAHGRDNLCTLPKDHVGWEDQPEPVRDDPQDNESAPVVVAYVCVF